MIQYNVDMPLYNVCVCVCLGVYQCTWEREIANETGTYCEDVYTTLHVKQLNSLVITKYCDGVNIFPIKQ